jgi:peroxiredoxin/outer membrane protein assembly factor BamD (BamD/ComL family)
MSRWIPVAQAAATLLLMTSSAISAPTVEDIFKYRPRQKDVEYETPAADQFAKCKVELEKRGKAEGWIVLGPEGQVLRRFVDADGSGRVNQWRYFNHGIEVYREIDTNKNNKPDQYRWLNLGGSRWGIDADEDGTIDSWRILSASEASREAIRAVVTGDDEALKALLVTAEDLRALGVEKQIANKILASVADAPKKARAVVARSKVLTSGSKWMKFDAVMPSVIPADDGKASADLFVYENAMVIVETGKQSGLVQIGEMIRVGEVWKLTQAPLPIEGETQVLAGGILMQPVIAEAAVAAPSPEMQKLLEELQKWDEKPPAPTASKESLARYNAGRADLLVKIYNLAESDEEKIQWMKQLIDGLSASVQTGAYPEGLPRLKTIEGELRKGSSKSPLVSYAAYRRIFAEYTVELQTAKDDERADVQKSWLKALEDFIGSYPEAEDTPDAMLQLAMNDEFMGKTKEATEWYQRILKEKPKSSAARKAQGAITRLSLKGKPITVSGPGLNGGTVSTAAYQGKAAVLVLFWATWCQPCTEELPELRAVYQQYRSQGFEIVGVSLDMTKDPIAPFLAQHKVPWPQIHQPGGLESPLAVQYGVFSPPVMILIDKSGKVVSRNATTAELKTVLPQLLKGN